MRRVDSGVAVLYDDRADSLGEFDRDRALAIPAFLRPARKDTRGALSRWSGGRSGRHVRVAVFVLQTVAAGVGEA